MVIRGIVKLDVGSRFSGHACGMMIALIMDTKELVHLHKIRENIAGMFTSLLRDFRTKAAARKNKLSHATDLVA